MENPVKKVVDEAEAHLDQPPALSSFALKSSLKRQSGSIARPDTHVLPFDASGMTIEEQFSASYLYPDPSKIVYQKPLDNRFWSGYLPAFVRRETFLGNWLAQSGGGSKYDKDFDVFTRIGYEGPVSVGQVSLDMGISVESARFLLNAGSFEEYLHRSAVVRQEQEDKETIYGGSFWEGLAAGIITMPLDPITYVPIAGAGVKGFNASKLAAKAASTPAAAGFRAAFKSGFRDGAKVGAAAIGATEVGLQALQTERDIEETVMNMAAGTLFSGLFVGTMKGVGHEWNMAKKMITEDLRLHGVQEHPTIELANTKLLDDDLKPGHTPQERAASDSKKTAKDFDNNLAAEMRRHDPTDPFGKGVEKIPDDDGFGGDLSVTDEAFSKSKAKLEAAEKKAAHSEKKLLKDQSNLTLSSKHHENLKELNAARDSHNRLELAVATKEATLKEMAELNKKIDDLVAAEEIAAYRAMEEKTKESFDAHKKIQDELDAANEKYGVLDAKVHNDNRKATTAAKAVTASQQVAIGDAREKLAALNKEAADLRGQAKLAAVNEALDAAADDFSDVTFGPIDPKSQKPRQNPDGTLNYPAATTRNGKIFVDREKILGMFDEKPWTKPKVKGVDPLPADAFKTPEEWLRFVIEHERAHTRNKRAHDVHAVETTAAYENRINQIALRQMVDKPAPPAKPPIAAPDAKATARLAEIDAEIAKLEAVADSLTPKSTGDALVATGRPNPQRPAGVKAEFTVEERLAVHKKEKAEILRVAKETGLRPDPETIARIDAQIAKIEAEIRNPGPLATAMRAAAGASRESLEKLRTAADKARKELHRASDKLVGLKKQLGYGWDVKKQLGMADAEHNAAKKRSDAASKAYEDAKGRLSKGGAAMSVAGAAAAPLARGIDSGREPTDAQRWARAYESVRSLSPEQRIAVASAMAKEGNSTALAYLAVHGGDSSLPVAKASGVVQVQRYDLTANMDFTIGGYGYRTTAMNTIVPDGRLPAGATEMVPLDFRNGIVIDDGSLNYRPGRLYRIAAETDINAQKQYQSLGSAGVGRWLAKMVSPIIRISESKSLVARDIINKLVVTPSHSAAAQAGIASHTPAAVFSQELFHVHTRVADELVDIRLSLKKPVSEARFNNLVSRFLLDSDSPQGARAYSSDGLAPELHSAVEKAAGVVEEKFFKVYDAEMVKVFPDYKGRPKYFPVQVIREKVDTDAFIKELTDVFIGQGAKAEDAARSALWVQNKWLNLTTDSALVNDAIVSSDFFHKWDTQFDGMKMEPSVKAEVWTVVNAARSATAEKFVSRATLGDELLTSLTKSGIENPEIVAKDILNDIYQNRSIFQSDDMATRGFMQERVLDVPAGFRAKYQDMNLPEVMRRYAKRAAPDIEITRAFGDPLMSGALKTLREDFMGLIENAKTVGERAKLTKEMNYTIDRLSKIRDDIRGVLNVPSDPNHWYHTANPVMRSLNYLAYSGNFALSNMADAGQATVMTGFKKHWWDGWVKYALDPEIRRVNGKEARSIGEGMDGELARSIGGLEDVTHGMGTRGPLQGGLEKATGFASMANLMSPMQDMIQRVNYTSQSNWFLRNVQAIAEGGKLSKSDQLWMSKIGVTDDAAKRIYAERGNWRDRRGTMVAYLDNWNDPEASKLFRDYMKHASKFNRVLADAGDKPMFYSTQMGRTMGQFKGFLFASASKIFLMRLQQRDARVLAAIVSQVGLGAMAYNLKNIAAGRATSEDPEELVRAGIEQSGVASFFYDGMRVLDQVTRNGVGFNPTARSRESQLFSPAEAAGSVFGPSVSYLSDAASVAYELPDALKRGYLSRRAIQDGRALIPLNQNIFLKQLFDAGVDKAAPRTR